MTPQTHTALPAFPLINSQDCGWSLPCAAATALHSDCTPPSIAWGMQQHANRAPEQQHANHAPEQHADCASEHLIVHLSSSIPIVHLRI